MATKLLSVSSTIVLILFLTCAAASKCGYQSCNKEKPGMLNIHVVPHTHDDVGWIMTVDQYYYKSVQFIIDTVIQELENDPEKRFIYVEIAFFSRWYDEQDDAMRHRVKRLVDEGRLEFILGGWCMNDEASPHYTAMIDQHKLGFEYLRKNFGECGRPRIGWQIDPFGHAREQASLFSQFGFDGLFFGRLDYQDKNNRISTKTMEMIWSGSPGNIGDSANLFTGVLPNGYNPPSGFCFDITCGDSKIKDNPKLHDYNVQKKVDLFLMEMSEQASWYNTNHLMITMGSDFNYVDAHMFYKDMDKLIKYVNAMQAKGSKVNLLYSTPSCYLKALNDESLMWPAKTDDFFPYADRAHGFWTGYFTSRPAFKYFARFVNSFFQSAKQMDALALLDNSHSSRKHLHRLAEVLGVAQHHDAISGTAKQAVDYDYTERLTEGLHKGQLVVQDVYNTVLTRSSNTSFPEQRFCPYLNISSCPFVEQQSEFQVTLYNPLAWPVQHLVRVPVAKSSYAVLAPDGKTRVPSEVKPVLSSRVQSGEKHATPAQMELVFLADLPATGASTFFVSKNSQDASLKFSSEHSKGSFKAEGTSLSGKSVQVDFTVDGRLESLTDKESGEKMELSQNYFYYQGMKGNNSMGLFQASGAYIFRPVSNTPSNIGFSTWTGIHKGALVQEARQQFGDYISQVVRVYENKPYVEVEWTVGPIPISDNIGKEVVTRYHVADFDNQGIFYTDSNGREILERKLNYRPTWDLDQTEAVAGNYFPVNAFFAIKDQKKGLQFTVLTDRTQGGTSLNNGDVELMLHRRLLVDDGKGVGEALNETGVTGKGLVVRGKHYLMLRPISQAASSWRPLAKEVFLTPQASFSASPMDPAAWIKLYNTTWSGQALPLPANVHLLSMEQFQHTGPMASPSGSTPYLVRLEHFYEKGEDANLSRPVSFDIQGLFSPFQLKDVYELTLGADLPLDKVQRLPWRTAQNPTGDVNPRRHLKGTVVSLGPMEIVTLQANIYLPTHSAH